MNTLRCCMLLFVMASVGLYAGVPERIEKDSPTQQKMQLSVEHKENPQNKNTVTITMSFQDSGTADVSLVSDGKNVDLKKAVKDGMLTVTFEVEKTKIDKSFVNITKLSDARCGNAFIVYLKGYIV